MKVLRGIELHGVARADVEQGVGRQLVAVVLLAAGVLQAAACYAEN